MFFAACILLFLKQFGDVYELVHLLFFKSCLCSFGCLFVGAVQRVTE